MVRGIFNFLLLLISIDLLAQQPVSVRNEAAQLKKVILEQHVSPRPIDDAFSEFVFNRLIDELDPDKLYFTQQEITELSAYKNKIDDDLNGTSWNFFPILSQRYKNCLLRVDGIITQHTKMPFDFSTNEIFVTGTTWAQNETENARRWHAYLKYETLNELVRIKKTMPDTADKDFLIRKESDARMRTQRSSLRMVRRMLNHSSGYENYVSNVLLQSIGLAFDPHSMYLSSTQMENFVGSLSTEGFYFGISVDENEKGDLVITKLTPGGPAWKSGEVHAGDVIEQIRWEGSEWIDVVGMSKHECDNLLMESNKNTIEFALLQTGGIQKKVRLRKEKMEAEENVVKSFILGGEKKIGYVSLPGFYTDWGEAEGSRCANDVAKEILKLKKENIDGLILDVRYNGGGSLNEAVAMGGIFIDAGPMGVLKEKSGEAASVKDMNRGTVYDGPLVLMVNGSSASASEFLAAALQDYRRAIIVGSKTYGKATGQVMLPLQPGKKQIDTSLDLKSGWGFSTVTTMKIYRITGKTAQQNGVTPDILLPDLYDFIDFREQHLKGALPADSVIKKTYYTPLTLLPLRELKQKSLDRIAGSKGFQITAECSKKLATLQSKFDSVSLNWSQYKNLITDEGKEFERLKEVTDIPTKSFTVANHAFDRHRIDSDTYVKEVNDVWTKNLLCDISLEEAFYIICDYIKTESSR